MSRRSAIGLAAACAALCGCGATSASHPARARLAPTQASRLARAQASHEYPSPRPPSQDAAGGLPTAVGAIRAFASAYVNWSAQTVSAQMRALATRSVKQARSVVSLAAAQTTGDYELQRGGIANSGTVEAIAPLLGSQSRYVVVTRERTSATSTTAFQGLRPAWHVALATAIQLAPGRWVVSAWQPES